MSTFMIEELVVYGVYDAGVPNMERIVLRALQDVDLGDFGLMIGIRANNGTALPIRDNLLWFGRGFIPKDDWIFVYTAPGEFRMTQLPNTTERIFSLHWGKSSTVFHGPELIPILFRMDGIQIPFSPPMITYTQESGI